MNSRRNRHQRRLQQRQQRPREEQPCLGEPDLEFLGQGGDSEFAFANPVVLTNIALAPDQPRHSEHEVDSNFAPAEVSPFHWSRLSMLSLRRVKANSPQEEIFKRLLHGTGRASCPMCCETFRRPAPLFQHLRDEHPNRLDRLCFQHFELFDSPMLAVGHFCVDCQILRTDPVLTADLNEAPPHRRFPSPLLSRHRALSCDDGATRLHRYRTDYLTYPPPLLQARSESFFIYFDLLAPLILPRRIPNIEFDEPEGDVSPHCEEPSSDDGLAEHLSD